MGLLVGFVAILLIYSDKLLAMQEACTIFLTLLFMRSSGAWSCCARYDFDTTPFYLFDLKLVRVFYLYSF